jgi:hypothetical protein
MFLELILSNTLPHRTRAAYASLHQPQHLIHIIRTAPFLVQQHIDFLLHLRLLHRLAIRPHPSRREVFRERVRDERGRVETGEGDELPAVAERGEARDVGFLLVGGHGGLPVEGGGEVIGESEREEVSFRADVRTWLFV